MNKANVIALCHKVAQKTGLNFNTVLLYYFLETILRRLSKGEYKDRFIFKGGFLLSNVIGVQTRSTVDLDFLIRNMPMSEESIKEVLEESLKNNDEDDIICELQGIQPIRENDQYGGFRVQILCRLENIRQVVPLDIATGDVITPYPVDYRYVSIFSDESIPIKAYPVETMIAEKLQTIYARGFLNSRSKDYYDLHILYKLQGQNLDADILKEACERTFRYRSTEFDVAKLSTLLTDLKEDESFLIRWKAYAKRNGYVGDISFAEVIDDALKLIKMM